MRRKIFIAIAITASLIVNCVTAQETATPPATTGSAQILKDGQVVKTINTYKVGQMPTVTTPSIISYNQATIPSDYNGLSPAGLAQISLDKATLFAMKPGETQNFNLLGENTAITYDHSITHDNGDTTWIGAVGNDDGRAIVTFGADGSMVGSIANGVETYNIGPSADGGNWMINPSIAGLIIPSFAGDAHQPSVADDATLTTTTNAASVPATPAATGNAASPIVVDIMVLYDSTLAYAATRINNVEAIANQTYIDSGLKNLAIRVVHTQSVTYSATATDATALTDLTGNLGKFNGVNTLRSKYAADVVVYMRPFNSETQGMICGVAWINGLNGSKLSAGNAYAVVGDGHDTKAACAGTTFAHEIGHTWGAVHDVADSAGIKGAYPYANGYGIANTYGDIMSYYQPQIAKFSSPDILALTNGNGDKYYLGIENAADVVSTFKNTTPIVAGFMSTETK